MTPSDKLTSFLKYAEGFRSRIYPDPPGTSHRSIGYGTQLTEAEIEFYCDKEITEPDATTLLQLGVDNVAPTVNKLVTVPLEQYEFDCLIAFAYNVGIGDKGFRGSTLLRKLNAGDKAAVPAELKRWHWAGDVPHVLDGRRAEEAAIWRNDDKIKGYNA